MTAADELEEVDNAVGVVTSTRRGSCSCRKAACAAAAVTCCSRHMLTTSSMHAPADICKVFLFKYFVNVIKDNTYDRTAGNAEIV